MILPGRRNFRFLLIFISLAIQPLWVFSQTIDHWESVIQEGDSWNYLLPSSEPDPSWTSLSFDDTSWSTGVSGFGYGDNDDNTIIPTTISIYLRNVFTISDISAIEEIILHMDYDDSFVAYLNGIEIARDYISGEPPLYNQASDGLHEARLYQGVPPESFNIDKSLLNAGENILAVQVHNQSLTSSDLTANPFLIVGINDNSFTYSDPPLWFGPPIEFTSSSLPIVIIDTKGAEILNDPKVTADLGIIDNGAGVINLVTDPWNEFAGPIGIEIRGESSQFFPKQSYGFETWDEFGNDIDTSFLDFPSEEDFILHGPYSDKSLFNNVLAMKLGRDLGQYTSRTSFVVLVINEEYLGVYVLMEKVKRDNDRVDIAKLRPEDISGDQLTGGYIIRIDKGQYAGWQSKYDVFGADYKIFFQYYYPDQEDIQPQQKDYIHEYVDDFEDAIASPTYKNGKGKHYLDYIDLRSFVDNFILNELSKNVDAYRLSTYFHKDRDSKGGKLKAGPLWDYNLAFGNGDYCGGDDTSGWEFYQCIGGSPFWWDSMLQNEDFVNGLRCRWDELRQTTLSTDNINSYLDSLSNSLSDATGRNFQRWPTLGIYVWPNSWFYASAQSHEEIIGYMKDWIAERSIWLDSNIPGVAQNCELYEPPYSGLITGIDDELRTDLSYYPNPVKDLVTIESEYPIREVRIINMMGQAIFNEKFNSRQLTIDLGQIARNGIYLMSIKTDKSVFVRKIKID
jgi:hypothetical protein